MLCEEEKSILETPWIISSVSDNLKAMKYTSLYQINPFDQPMDGQPIPDKLRVKFYILNIQPYDPWEFVQSFCKECVWTFSLKDYDY